jgi:hypothetical protein
VPVATVLGIRIMLRPRHDMRGVRGNHLITPRAAVRLRGTGATQFPNHPVATGVTFNPLITLHALW